MNEIEQGKQTAIVSYLTIIGTIIAIFMNNETKNSFASFHIRQALGIFITFFLLGYPIGYFDNWMVTASFWTFIFILWVYECVKWRTKTSTFFRRVIPKII